MPTNTAVRLVKRPVGLPVPDDFEVTRAETPELADGEALVAVSHISLDPAMRGWMSDMPSYITPVGLGDVMRALAVGTVVESRSDAVAEGDAVSGLLGVQSHVVVNGGAVQKVDASTAPLPKYLSALGMPGMTAYFGLLAIGDPQPGETVVVSGAAGAVGQLVGQIAKIKDARAVGIAGGADKCAYVVDELGFDAAIDYKSGDVGAGLLEHAPDGIDVYFDNVGGDILDAALANLARKARVVICGAISQYNNTDAIRGPSNYLALLVKHASMTGFVVSDYGDRLAEGAKDMATWIGEGRLKSREHVVDGLETFPETLLMLFNGANEGKLVIAV